MKGSKRNSQSDPSLGIGMSNSTSEELGNWFPTPHPAKNFFFEKSQPCSQANPILSYHPKD